MLFREYRVYPDGRMGWGADSSSLDSSELRSRMDLLRKLYGEGHPYCPTEGGIDAYIPSGNGGWTHIFTLTVTYSGVFGLAQESGVFVHNLPADQIARGRIPAGLDRSFPKPEVDTRPIMSAKRLSE